MDWPDWWDWELAFTGHLEKRMEERGFSEIDLRQMLESATGMRAGRGLDRWEIETRHAGQSWSIVVEPDPDDQVLVVVTAYPVNPT